MDLYHRYESIIRQCLVDLTTAAKEFITTNLISYGAYGAAIMTSAASLAFAVSLPVTLLSAVSQLDNPLNMALTKSEQAGKLLARNVLANYVGGKRPVTLSGYGMGARVIVYCLLELLSMVAEQDIFGIIDSVYLFGTPVSLSAEQWSSIRPIVSDRFVNAYSENDWFLKILFRLHPKPTAGTKAIECDGIENIDVSSLIKSHDEYAQKENELLIAVGFDKVL
jgi:hypothetical protein